MGEKRDMERDTTVIIKKKKRKEEDTEYHEKGKTKIKKSL